MFKILTPVLPPLLSFLEPLVSFWLVWKCQHFWKMSSQRSSSCFLLGLSPLPKRRLSREETHKFKLFYLNRFPPKDMGEMCVCWPDTEPILFRFPLLRGYRFSDARQLPPPNGAPKMEDQVKSLIWQILLNCTQLTFHMNYRFGQKETKEKKYNHWIIGKSCSPFGSRSSPPPPPTSVPPKAERRRRRR